MSESYISKSSTSEMSVLTNHYERGFGNNSMRDDKMSSKSYKGELCK